MDHFPLGSPTDTTYFSPPHSQHSPSSPTLSLQYAPGSFNLGYGYAGNTYSTTSSSNDNTGSDEEGKSLELHCHPKSGVPMTVIVDLGSESLSGKRIRVDMIQAGE